MSFYSIKIHLADRSVLQLDGDGSVCAGLLHILVGNGTDGEKLLIGEVLCALLCDDLGDHRIGFIASILLFTGGRGVKNDGPVGIRIGALAGNQIQRLPAVIDRHGHLPVLALRVLSLQDDGPGSFGRAA